MKKEIFYLGLLGVAGIAAAAFLFPGQDNAEQQEVVFDTPPAPEPRNVMPRQLEQERMNLAIFDTFPKSDFVCPTTRVGEEVRAARQEVSQEAALLNARYEELLGRSELPREVIRGREDTAAVALTVDTGTAGAYGTDELLRIADYYDIPLTFFVTGCWALENPELMRRIVAEGHSLGHHTLTHLNLKNEEGETIARELDEPIRIIEETTGVRVVLFRKPQYAGGEDVVVYAGERGMISVQGWPDFGDTLGWVSETTPEEILERIQSRTAPGAIWVFHNISISDLRAFEDMVRFHLEEGYDLVPVEDLIQ